MKKVYVDLAERKYPIMIGQGVVATAGPLLKSLEFTQAPIVVSNARVWRLHGSTLMRSLQQEYGRVPVIHIGDGERYKNHSTLMKIYRGMFRAHADRGSWVLAFGGGVVGDIAGFAAATFMRGIPCVMAPTTLLSQVDSSIGGKVGINVAEGKNLIGAFHQPAAVLTDPEVLKTLPKRELVSGLQEIIKSAAIRSKSLLRYLERNLPAILACESQQMEHIVGEAAKIKAEVVSLDEKEGGLRTILNFGHTIGHAFETATDYRRFKHGEAVAWGMIAALEYGKELGTMDSGEADRLAQLVHRTGRLPSLQGISLRDLWSALARDKKFLAGDIRMVLLRNPGEAEIQSRIDPVSLKRFLKSFLSANTAGRT
ncbi:MAG: 3-dehydroquinate synthase [Acidobacteria bacterium]|nr:3-dehydroquinate synthase [Acidobacteriota bacterium]